MDGKSDLENLLDTRQALRRLRNQLDSETYDAMDKSGRHYQSQSLADAIANADKILNQS